MPLDPLTVAIVVLGVIVACLVILYAMRKRGGKREMPKEESHLKTDFKGYPFRIDKTVPTEDAKKAREDLRILDLEREILGDAIRRLYEAHAEGKITEEERERLAETYKSRMMTVKDAISKDESLVALHELESMQEDLIKLFSERFDEIGTKIEELREKTELQPIKEVAIQTPKTSTDEVSAEKPETEGKATRKKKPTSKPSPRTEAEKRIEEIRAEVEKVLDRLGQMEIES